VTLPVIEALSSLRIYMPEDLRPIDRRQSVGKSLKEAIKRFPEGIPLLDPLEDMKIEDGDFKKVIRVTKFPGNFLYL
jgi:ATP-dependent RNA helicase DOB1